MFDTYSFTEAASVSSFTWIAVKSAFNRSLKIEDVLSISPSTLVGGLAPFKFSCIFFHFATRFERSWSIASTFLSLATVRIITPKFFGRIPLTTSFKRFRSSLSLIFWEIDTLFEKGTRTKYLPARVISEQSRGPLADIGSLATCTNIGAEEERVSLILPSLGISFSDLK